MSKMMTTTGHRKWTAQIELDDDGQPFAVETLTWDTLAEVTTASIAEAARVLRTSGAQEARVRVYKQLTRDPEPRYDRQVAYLWVEDGRVWVHR